MNQLALDNMRMWPLATDRVSSPTDSSWCPTLAHLFQRSAARHADRAALWLDGVTVSYRELHDLATQVAGSLMAAGFADGLARCAILGSRGLIDFAGILGALFARCTYVPLHVRRPLAMLARMLEEADASALVVGRKHLDCARRLLSTVPGELLVLLPDSSAVPDWAPAMPQHRFLTRSDLSPCGIDELPQARPEDGAYLLFTSGTTGAPKGVLVHHRNVIPYLRSVTERYAPSPDDRCTQLFDLTFDLSVHDMFVCWAGGGSLFCVPDNARFAPRHFLRRHRLTTWFSVPSSATTMMGMRSLRPGDFPSLRLALFCGEALPSRVAQAFSEAAPNAVIENLYGPTEATIALTFFRLPDHPAGFHCLPSVIPIGAPLPGQDAMVVNADGKPATKAEDGELCLSGSQVTDGYWQRPDLTSQRFVRFAWDPAHRVWYRTGDRVRYTSEHGLIFLGRLDRQVKIAGHRVELQEIEAVLHRAAGANAAAIAWPIGPDGLARDLIGFVGRTTQPVPAILEACRAELPPYAVPSAVHSVADWPVTPSGKTDHARLRAVLEKTPRALRSDQPDC
jgi:D-alanine--poly(phosphoribitol) ligase subunit 1